MALANQAKHSFSYDPAKLVLTQETVEYDFNKDGTADFTRTLDRSRDNLLRPTGFQLKNGAIIETAAAYTFDNANRLSTVSDGTNTFIYAYLAQAPGLVQSVTGPAHTVTNTYEPHRNVLVTKTNSVPSVSSVVSQFDYTSNKLGQRTALASTGTAFTTPHNWDWTYNGPGEVINADSSNNTFDQSWNFDGIGNRKTATYYDPATGNPATAGYTTNPWNQYTAITGQPAGRTQDPDGNLTVGTIPADVSANSTLVWDAENRLTKITKPNGDEIDYQYDSQSRRISKKVTAATIVTAHTAFVYDGWNPVGEYSITATLTSTLSKSYLWGMDLSGSLQGAGGVGGLLCVHQHGTDSNNQSLITNNYFPTFDGNGNVSEYLNNQGEAVAHYEYDPFGKTVAATGPKANDFTHRFSTKPLDAETGLYNYVFRLYNPISGRWESRDPIEERGGVNLYGFVGNDGVNRADILGLTKCEGKADLGNRKFSLKETYLGGVTRKGKPAEQIIELAQDLLNDIQNLGRLQAVGNIAAGGVIGGIQGMVPDATVLALGEANPDLVDFIGGKLGEINRGIGNNPAKGAMITVEYQCLKCICTDEDDWYNPADWFQSGDIYGWDDPDIQQQSYSVELEGDLIEFENRKFVLYKTVKEITLQDIVDAVERSRESCEK